MLALTFGFASLAIPLAPPFITWTAWLLARKMTGENLAMPPTVMLPVAIDPILLKLFGKTDAVGPY